MAAPTGAALALVTRFAHGLRRGSLRSMARYRSMLASLVGNISTLKAPYVPYKHASSSLYEGNGTL